MQSSTEVLIIGAGIGGLTLALSLHQAGIACSVHEAAPEIRPLGVGINVMPQAVRELDELGLLDALAAVAVTTRESAFFNRFGQLIYSEPAGRGAGYDWPQLSFVSKRSPRLQLEDGHPNAQQLQTIREFTPESANLIQTLWGRDAATPAKAPAAKEPPLDWDVLDELRTRLARLEQSAARSLLLQGRSTLRCSFCGRDVPVNLVVAAHIKPRADCTLDEKKAIATNIVGLCKLGCDDLFERGYLDVVNGVIVKGPEATNTTAATTAVSQRLQRRVDGWTTEREPFFAWRRNHRTDPTK